MEDLRLFPLLTVVFGVLIAFLLVTSATSAAPAQLHMMNVNDDSIGGHGDSYLIIANGSVSMIDTGLSAQVTAHVLPFLKSLKISHIDNFFNTHPHSDHIQGLTQIISSGITIGTFHHNRPPLTVADWAYVHSEYESIVSMAKSTGAVLNELFEGDAITTPAGSFHIVHAQKNPQLNGKTVIVNDYSAVIRWDYHGVSTLFPGDLESTVGALVAKKPDIKAHIFAAPHHGGMGVGPKSFYTNVGASLHLYSSTNEVWNIVSRQSRQWTSELGAKYCHNGQNGKVSLSISREEVSVSSDRPTPHCPNEQLTIAPITSPRTVLAAPAAISLLWGD